VFFKKLDDVGLIDIIRQMLKPLVSLNGLS